MAKGTYIGPRMVPVVADPQDWAAETVYESLTIVTHDGGVYMSKRSVPAGTEPPNATYWMQWPMQITVGG